jgi:hypothetical protein
MSGIIYLYEKRFRIGRLDVRIDQRSRKSRMGRFGGGWNWKVGVMVGGRTVIISLLVLDVRIQAVRRAS